MSLLTNYIKDLQKSKTTPLLIELSKKDLDAMSKEGKSGLDISSYIVKEIYDRELKDAGETNLIYIDADKADDTDKIYLLDEFLERITDQVKEIKNLNIAKEGIKQGLSFATGGFLDSVFGGFIDQGIDFISSGVADLFIETVREHVDLSDMLLGTAEEKIHEVINDISIHFLDEIQKNEICLSSDAKQAISELSKEFKKELTAAESFRLILQLMLSVAIDNPKILFIKNPHKLDKNSLAILSMLFSFSKDAKEQEKHTGLSVVYAYEDEAFQPYSEVKEEFKQSKMLLDEQRRFTQRYAMLERPTSDIPHIAVKSTMFVGRQEELEKLNARYHSSKEHKDIATLEVISGDPGVGKTKLIKKHLEEIRPKEGEGSKQIQLTLLNQVGHTSTNTGIGSLIDSIVKEAQRLENVKTWNEKVIDTLKEKAQDGVLGFIKSALGVDALIDVGTAFIDRVETDSQIKQIQHNTMGEQDNKAQDKKQEQFNNLNRAIKKLQELSDGTMPIVLFIDDLQWIDEDSAEYIIEHFIKVFNVHMVASIRPGDATTTLKQAYTNKGLNPYKIALIKKVGVKIYDNEHEIVMDSDINIHNIDFNATHLLGLDSITLTSLISQVIKPIDNDDTKQKILATTIINKLNNDKNKDEVNTLFAVETINMLCDEKLYEADSIERLILTDRPLRFNTELSNFQESLEHAFKILHDKYQIAFEHINTDKKFEQKFNLMAYAVLEERLHILKIYFGEHGNAAVNTLLFSSLLGTPFNSTIVKNILDALSTTDEKLLKPLKEYILKGNDEITLNETHYEIIEEVYEILSRYQAFNSAYEHRHSLLNIFLDKQLEYQLDTVFTEDSINAKNSLYTLVLKKIKEEEEQQDFYEAHEASLESKQYESMLFYQQAWLNVLEKAYQQTPGVWAEAYTLSLNNLAVSYYRHNRLDEAIALQKKAFDIRKSLYEEDPVRWAEDYTTSLSNLAQFYKHQNRLEEMIILEEQALDIRKSLYEEDPVRWAEFYTISLSNLAASYYSHNRLDEAVTLQEQVLEILKSLYESNPDRWAEHYSRALSNLAPIYEKLNRLDEAIISNEQALEIRKSLYEINPDRWVEFYTISLSNLAQSYKKQNRLDEAVTLQEQALEIRKSLYESNPDRWAERYINALMNLSDFYYDQKQFDKAFMLDQESYETTIQLYNEDPNRWVVHYSESLNNLAYSYKEHNKFNEAIELFEIRYDVHKNIYGTDHSRTLEVLQSIEKAKKSQEQNEEDTTLEEESIALKDQSLKISELETYAMVLNNLASSNYEKDNIDEAIELYEQSLEIRQALYQGNPDRFVKDYTDSLNNLSVALFKLNRISESLNLLETQYGIFKDMYGSEDSRTLNVLQNLEHVRKFQPQRKQIEHNSINATLTDLLYLSKYIAKVNEEDYITLNIFVSAFGFIEFSEEAKSIFSQIIDLNKIGYYSDSKQYIEQVNDTQKIPYSEELKVLVYQLKEIFGDKSIGILR